MPFRRERLVRFNDIDRAGIVYFAQAFQYCHEVYEDLLSEALGCSLEEHFARGEWGTPLVHAEADYLGPMRLGERLAVLAEVERVGRSSVTYAYRIVDEAGGERARIRLVHACVALTDFAGIPIPAPLAQGLERLGLWSAAQDSADRRD